MNLFITWLYPIVTSILVWLVTTRIDRRWKSTWKSWIKGLWEGDEIYKKIEIYTFTWLTYNYFKISTKFSKTTPLKQKISKDEYDTVEKSEILKEDS